MDEQTEQNLIAMVKKIQEQLMFLERKIDTLINKPQERSFNKERSPYQKPFQKSYSKPYQKSYSSFGHSHHSSHSGPSSRGDRDQHSSRERDGDYNKKPFFQKKGKPKHFNKNF